MTCNTMVNVAIRETLNTILHSPLMLTRGIKKILEEDVIMINIPPWGKLPTSPISCEDEETSPLSWTW